MVVVVVVVVVVYLASSTRQETSRGAVGPTGPFKGSRLPGARRLEEEGRRVH